MKPFKYLFISFMFICSCSSLSVKNKVRADQVNKIVSYLASDKLKGRKTGSEGIEMAAVFIENNFKSYGLKPYFKDYRDSLKIEGLDAYNIVGFLEGNDPKLKDEIIIVGAHYDHIGFEKKVGSDSIANGANDNAAGTSAVLTLAKYFAKKQNHKRSLIFALFTAEEMGLVQSGARHLANTLKFENIDLYVMINFEMIGVPMKDKEYDAYLTGFDVSNMGEKINEYTNSHFVGLLPKAKKFELFRRSDNFSFYEVFSKPSHTISTFDFTNYDFYHHVKDEAEKLDFNHIASIINKIIPAIEAMSNTSDRDIKLKETKVKI